MTKSASQTIAPPGQRIGFLIYRAGVLVARAYEARMRPLGFAPAEIGLMTYLASHGTDHVRAVARSIGVSPQTVVNLTRGLEQRGFVARAPSPSDQRTVLLTLTVEGRAALEEADTAAQAFDAEVAAVLGPVGAQAVGDGLRTLLSAPPWDAE